jgi:hypothetical protein
MSKAWTDRPRLSVERRQIQAKQVFDLNPAKVSNSDQLLFSA